MGNYINTFLSGGCSFTFGNELSDDDGKTPSSKTWAKYFSNNLQLNYFSVAKGGLGNQGIARRVFDYLQSHREEKMFVAVMWTFVSRYDWAMPRHHLLEDTRWATITPWDTEMKQKEIEKKLANSEPVLNDFRRRRAEYQKIGIGKFADALYRYAANQYYETYLSWQNIIWLQNYLEKHKIPYFFTLADNSLFYDGIDSHQGNDRLLKNLYDEINFDSWYFFGERKMGFNQWAKLNDYEYATTHPLDQAHADAVQLMKPKLFECYRRYNND
jgi:hypothetical protein